MHLKGKRRLNCNLQTEKKTSCWAFSISKFFCILVAKGGIYIKRYKARPHGANGVNGSFHSQNTQTKGCIKRQYFGSIRQNIATGKSSHAITPFQFVNQFNFFGFYHKITSSTRKKKTFHTSMNFDSCTELQITIWNFATSQTHSLAQTAGICYCIFKRM